MSLCFLLYGKGKYAILKNEKRSDHMTALMKIQSFIQAYVQAIASILEADVTVVDNELQGVRKTIYLQGIGECSISHF